MEANFDYRVKHSLPGRLRVAFPFLLSDKELIERIKMYLSDGRGVVSVAANNYSGSITIYYDPKITGEKDLFDMLDNITCEKLANINGQGRENGGGNGGWNLAGKVFGAIGIVAVFIPLMPGIPLLLLAAFCQEKADGSTT